MAEVIVKEKSGKPEEKSGKRRRGLKATLGKATRGKNKIGGVGTQGLPDNGDVNFYPVSGGWGERNSKPLGDHYMDS